MKYGIYYAYWEQAWDAEQIPYIEKVKRLGFDVLEVACAGFYRKERAYFQEMAAVARDNGILLSGGYGPIAKHNLTSEDSVRVNDTFAFYRDMFEKMELAGIDRIGGALYSYWPVDYNQELNKAADLERSIDRMKTLADLAADYGITLNMEALNRFEGYLLNDAKEAVDYVRAVDKENVKVMLDTFHMNIEEDSFHDAILSAGELLGHFHVGEANRRPPRQGRMPWDEIAKALKQVQYGGYVVMEPFIKMGGQVGKDIRLWRDISNGATVEQMDLEVGNSVCYLRGLLG